MNNFYMINFKSIGDEEKGYLVALQKSKEIPFEIKRVYYTYGVPMHTKRGFHAHKKLEQTLFCLNGSIKVKCFDGEKEEVFTLTKPYEGLYLGTMVWHEMFDYSKDSVIMVIASDVYKEEDYIRNYEEYIKILKENKNYFVHEKAIVDSNNIGKDTRIWGFSHIFENAVIGENCNICEHVLIENDVTLGDNVTVKSGVYIWDGIFIEDNVFIGPSVSFVNDKHPRSKMYPEEFSKTIIKKGASIGSNATILCDIIIGQYATVGAGTVVTKDINDFEIVVGNPGKVIGYNCICGKKLIYEDNKAKCSCEREYEKKDDKVYEI